MVLKEELIQTKDPNLSIVMFKDGLVRIQINFATGVRGRLSKSTIFMRLKTTVLQSMASSVKAIGEFKLDPELEYDSSYKISMSATSFGRLLATALVDSMRNIQANSVVYKSVDISCSVPGAWSSEGVLVMNGGLQTVNTYRLKSGSGMTGKLSADTFVSKQTLSFSLYGKDLPVTNAKPSRFLVQGCSFQADHEARQSTYVADIENFLTNGYSATAKFVGENHTIELVPLSDTLGTYREVDIAQFEGLRNVAGASKGT